MLDPVAAALLEALGQDPDPEQALCRALGVQKVFVVARAGSGKTEVLAARAASLAQRKLVVPPRQLLALTFTNRAVDNLTSRLRRFLGLNYDRYVAVHNFHGFAARLLSAHGSLVGVDPAGIDWPDARWRRAAFEGLDRDRKDEAEEALRLAKRDPVDDGEVIKRLERMGNQSAIEFELQRQSDSRLDYDDVLRHAERLLGLPEIAKAYRDRYPVVLVDEVQDLSPPQLRIVLALGIENSTAAGDPTQSIFRFAGADPDRAFAAFETLDAAVVRLSRSYRSSPAVLRVVNALGDLEGAVPIVCADPSQFPDEGVVATLVRDEAFAEARDLLTVLRQRVLTDAEISVGVVVRASRRSSTFEALCSESDVKLISWTRPTHDPGVVALVRRHRPAAVGEDDFHRLASLREMCLADVPVEDIDLVSEVRAAFDILAEHLDGGIGFDQVIDECRASGSREQPVGAGLHLLNGHVGKGQQFDWVVILGAEQGHIPWFSAYDEDEIAEERRLFGVMASRARYGLVITSVRREQDRYGGWHAKEPTPWMEQLSAHVTQVW